MTDVDPGKMERDAVDPGADQPDTTVASTTIANNSQIKDDFALFFLDILTAPLNTMQAIMAPEAPLDGKRLGRKTCLLVVLVSAISGLASASPDFPAGPTVIAVGAILGGLINWIALSWLLHIFSNWVTSHHVTFKSCLIGVGWSFLPMIFDAPVSCFRPLLHHFYYPALGALWVWSAYILWLAFKEAMQMSTLRAVLLFLFGPPLMVVSSFFWM
ncbi:MAG TPA: Yip1 family protein, partial [Chroococcales cyanobacterium]